MSRMQYRSINQVHESGDSSTSIKDVINKIKTSEYSILYSPWCGYSKAALALLKEQNISPQKFDIEKINGSMNEIRTALSNVKSIGFPFEYSTRPMIFVNGEFLGGYQELKNHF